MAMRRRPADNVYGPTLFCRAGERQRAMADQAPVDHYEVLQISANAELETIHRVYRLLAQRFHPDNQDTGDADRFHAIREAYAVLSDPEKRGKYDAALKQNRDGPWRPAAGGAWAENDFEFEQSARLTALEVLYTRRRIEPRDPGLYDLELEQLLGVPREHLEFTAWYLIEKGFIRRGADSSRLTITAEGVEYLEEHLHRNVRRRLRGVTKQEADPPRSAV
jgi:curved DNA-binding protein CbpA